MSVPSDDDHIASLPMAKLVYVSNTLSAFVEVNVTVVLLSSMTSTPSSSRRKEIISEAWVTFFDVPIASPDCVICPLLFFFVNF